MSEEPPKIKHTLLIIGILMLLAGFIGVLGLRLGIIQPILGISDPYPGIGTAEPMGHVVSMVPFVLGIVTVAFWGIKNDPIYHEIEKAKEEEEVEAEDGETEEEDTPEEIETPPVVEPIEESHGTLQIDDMPDELVAPLNELEEALGVKEIDELEAEIRETKPKPRKETAKKPGPVKPAEDLNSKLADELRIERCRKMLSFASVTPEDEAMLNGLIEKGTSVREFTEEVKKAVERRKKKAEEEARTADQKAAIVEEEVLSELISLEDDIGEDMNEEDLEDLILSGLDDLEEEAKKDD